MAQQKIEYLQNIEFREYNEEITDLKHMLAIRDSKSTSLSPNTLKAKNKEKGVASKSSDRGRGREWKESASSSNFQTKRET